MIADIIKDVNHETSLQYLEAQLEHMRQRNEEKIKAAKERMGSKLMCHPDYDFSKNWWHSAYFKGSYFLGGI